MPESIPADKRTDLSPVGRAILKIKEFGQPKVDSAYRFLYNAPGTSSAIDAGKSSGVLVQGPPEDPKTSAQEAEARRLQAIVDQMKLAQEQSRIEDLRNRLKAAQ